MGERTRIKYQEVNLPLFKRRKMTIDTAFYYALNTDVWVYGSADAYLDFSRRLVSLRESWRSVAEKGRGMDVLILPPAADALREFLVLHERLVYQEGRFNMELIIGGTSAGYEALAGYFERSARAHSGDPDEHLHLDDEDDMLVLPSVFLNIRGPLEDLEAHFEALAAPDEDDLPLDMDWRDPDHWPYEVIEDYDSLHGRLPVRRRRP